MIFNQQRIPGLMGLSDFTKLKDIIVTIGGKPFKHFLYHFRLVNSNWRYMAVVCGGESFQALIRGHNDADIGYPKPPIDGLILCKSIQMINTALRLIH